jgi:hypothetical protein
MKLTKAKLKQIIKEELQYVLKEIGPVALPQEMDPGEYSEPPGNDPKYEAYMAGFEHATNNEPKVTEFETAEIEQEYNLGYSKGSSK